MPVDGERGQESLHRPLVSGAQQDARSTPCPSVSDSSASRNGRRRRPVLVVLLAATLAAARHLASGGGSVDGE
jgi:hypothetical protein